MALSFPRTPATGADMPVGSLSPRTSATPEVISGHPTGAGARGVALARASTPARLLVIEQDPALRQMLSWDFADLGYRVTEAWGVQAARQAIEQGEFDLVLLEFTLPDGGAVALIRELSSRFPGLPLIMNSGRPEAVLAAEGMPELFAFVPKPSTTRTLHRLFQRALARFSS